MSLQRNGRRKIQVPCQGLQCQDVFSSIELPITPHNKVYNKESKVVISVTVQGSPGPVRIMIKMSSSVEDTINHVVDKYKQEGRTPILNDDASSSFELYHSHFSLQSLKKSDIIGDMGTRSFYLRKDNTDTNISEAQTTITSFTSENIAMRTYSDSLSFPISDSMLDKFNKVIRRSAHNFCKIFSCLPCNR